MARPLEHQKAGSPMTARRMILTAVFFASLIPLSSPDGLGINYIFMLVPLFTLLVRGRARYPGDTLLWIMGMYALIFFCASLYQVDLLDEVGRRLVSFLIFLSIFSYTFIKVDEEMVAAFKAAVVGVSAYFSLASIYGFLVGGGAAIGYAAKDLVGTQRIGFVYVLAIWLVYMYREQSVIGRVVRYPIMLLLTAGLLMTFSRASIVAILASGGLFAISSGAGRLRALRLGDLVKAVSAIAGVLALLWILYQLFPLPFDFFGDTLFRFFSDWGEFEDHLQNPGSSEGTRVVLAEEILNFVARNPLTGSGYLGVWVLPDVPTGSAHNQYTDVLFRTGILGFMAYAFIILTVVRYLAKREKPLFWGVMGVLAYGMFHETFKETHGAFILAFLLGMASSARRDREAPAEAQHDVGAVLSTGTQ